MATVWQACLLLPPKAVAVLDKRLWLMVVGIVGLTGTLVKLIL